MKIQKKIWTKIADAVSASPATGLATNKKSKKITKNALEIGVDKVDVVVHIGRA